MVGNPRHLRRRCERGLTLIDMAVALTLLAIMAAIMVPALASRTRNLQAEELVEEVQMIIDASKWYYYNEDLDNSLSPQGFAEWPGQRSRSICGYDWFDTDPGNTRWDRDARRDLEDDGYLGSWDNWRNPWGMDYELDGYGFPKRGQALPAGSVPNCWFRITTEIPIDSIPAVEPFFPNLSCYGVGAPEGAEGCRLKQTPPSGFWRCCVHVPRPGREINLWYQIMDLDGKGYGEIPCSPWQSRPGKPPDNLTGPDCPTQDVLPSPPF